VHVVTLVAGAAVLRQLDLVGGLHVTALAVELGVRALEHELGGLAVIELPELPAVRVVTGGAFLAEVALVDVVDLVAGDALARGVAEGAVRVALLAGDRGV
jgi:hypothetical protein